MRPAIKSLYGRLLAPAAFCAALLAPAFAQDDHPENGVLKICKVAGEGIEVGEAFVFDVDGPGSTDGEVTVQAGPGPGGYCWFFPQLITEGSLVYVTETLLPGVVIEDISVNPPARDQGHDEASGVTRLTIGPGVTEVTYTNVRRTGFIEICKLPEHASDAVAAEFPFTIEGVPGETVVFMSSCSPPIEVPAGDIRVTEGAAAGWSLSGCGVWPNDRLVQNHSDGITVSVPAGGVTTQTLVGCFNARTGAEGSAPAPMGLKKAAPGNDAGALFKRRPRKSGGK